MLSEVGGAGDVELVEIELVRRHVERDLRLTRGDQHLGRSDGQSVPQRDQGEGGGGGEVGEHQAGCEGLALLTPGVRGETDLSSTQDSHLSLQSHNTVTRGTRDTLVTTLQSPHSCHQ